MFAPCVSASICHNLTRHPDESKFVKDKKKTLKSMKEKASKLQEDITQKKGIYKGIQSTFAARVQSDLINCDPQKYLRKTTTGQMVPNWLLVNSDVRKLERVCEGKLPSKDQIPQLLKQYNEQFDVLKSTDLASAKKINHINPVKALWEKKGVKFPGFGPAPNTTKVTTCTSASASSGESLHKNAEIDDYSH